MNRFGSFNVDHNKLNPGIYLSRVDQMGDGRIFTVDIRTQAPYRDRTLTHRELHSVEHVLAYRFEEMLQGSGIKKVYFGPFGCQTGWYMLFYVPDSLNLPDEIIHRMLIERIRQACDNHITEVPFNSTTECGNSRTLATDPDDIADINSILDHIESLCDDCGLGFNEYPYIEE